MSRALESQLDALHGLVCGVLGEELERALSAARDPENPVPINPQLIDKVLKFLAQNGVDAPKASPRVDRLAMQLADLDLEAEVLARN